jgi:hypothetical protein
MPEPSSSRLHDAVAHADHFADALRREDHEMLASPHSDPRAPTEAERWIIGRASEVDAFVEDVLREHRDSLLSADAAAALIEGFVLGMHDDFAVSFGRPMRGCCHGEAAEAASAWPYLRALRRALGRAAAVVSAVTSIVTPTPPNR